MSYALLNSPAEIVRQFLTTRIPSGASAPLFLFPTQGTITAWQLFVPEMPDGQNATIPVPDSCACVRDTTGMESWRSMTTGKTVYKYGFQIRLRAGLDIGATQFSAGYTLLNQTIDLLQQPGPGVVSIGANNYPIDGFETIGSVISLGQDIHRRELYSANAMVTLAFFA